MANLKGILDSIRKIMWQDTGLNGDAQRIEQLGWMLFLKIFSDKDKELEVTDDDYVSPIPEELHWDAWAGDDEGITGDELQEFVDRDLFSTLRNLEITASDNLRNKRALIVREVFEGNNNYMKSGINIRKVLNKLNEIDFNVAKDRHAFGELYETILKELQSAGKSGEFYTPRAITEFITDIVDPKLGEKILDPSCGTGGYLTAAIEHLNKQANSVEDYESIANNILGWEYKPLPYLLATTNLILHDVEVPNISFRDSLDQPLSNYTEKHRVNAILANPPFGGIVANNNENNFPTSFKTKESADLFLVLMIHLLKKGGRAGIVLPDGSLTGDGVKQRVRQRLLEECNLHTIIRLPNSVFQPYATVATNLLFFTKGEPTKEVWYYEHQLPQGQKSYSKTKPIKVKEFTPIKEWWHKRKESELCWKVDFAKRIAEAKLNAQPFWDKAEQGKKAIAELKEEVRKLTAQIKNSDITDMLEVTKQSTQDTIQKVELEVKQNQQAGDNILFAAYDLDIKNPNNKKDNIEVTSGELIQELSKDLSTIQSDIEGIQSSLSFINEYSYKTIGELCDVIKGNTGIKKAIEGEFPLVVTAEERSSHNEYQFDCEAVCIPLVSSSGHGHASLKRVHYQDGKFALGSILAAAIPKDELVLSAKYLYYYLNNFKDELLVPLMKGMANVSLSVSKIKTVKIKLPPLEKQEELVRMMEKCEKLRETLAKSTLDAEKMIMASLNEALSPQK